MNKEKARAFFTMAMQYMDKYKRFTIENDSKMFKMVNTIDSIELTNDGDLYLHGEDYESNIIMSHALIAYLEFNGIDESIVVVGKDGTVIITGLE